MTFRCSGDLGDNCFQAAILHAQPGTHSFYCVDRPGITSAFTPRIHLLKPLYEVQPYFDNMVCTENDPDVDLVNFRRFHSPTTTLISANASEYNMQTGRQLDADGSAPWLFVEPDKAFASKIIIARSPRYNSLYFPWRQIVEHYGKRLLFIGLPEEHMNFCAAFGPVPHLRIKDYLEMARYIAGAALFIGNQSSPHAVAMGLGGPIIQETSMEIPDCIYKRDNVQYVSDGACTLPDVAGSGELVIESQYRIKDNGSRTIVPPGGWQYPEIPTSTSFRIMLKHVISKDQVSAEEADKRLFLHNAKRCPAFFGTGDNNPFLPFQTAYRNAFGKEPELKHLESQ